MIRQFFTCLTLFSAALLPLGATAQNDLDTSAMDMSTRPQDDLFRYVNGSWLDDTEIPADKSNFGSFIVLDDNAKEQIRELIETISKSGAEPGSDEQKIGDYFKSFMDLDAAEAAGIVPLREELQRIHNLASKAEVFDQFAHFAKIGVSSPVGVFVSQDAKNSTRYICQVTQSGITLPDRDYYLNDEEKSVSARDAMKAYVARIFDVCEFPGAELAPKAILELESKLAKSQIPRVELRDAEKRYNLFRVDEMMSITKNLNWQSYLNAATGKNIEEVNVNTPSYFDGLNEIVETTDLDTWKMYLSFRLVNSFAPILNKDLVDAHFELNSKEIAGIDQQLPRWKRAVNAISGAGAGDFGALGDVVGKLYVAEHFPPESKEKMDVLVNNLLVAFGGSIDELKWMTDATKVKAKEKLGKITTKIGYTKQWRDYSGLTVVADNLFANTVTSNILEFKRNINKLGKPVDREEWGMTPQTVNAYYNPTKNEIVFPAAILQSPFFNKDAEPALNYGGIGAVIGHEISHAFDDQGSKYDGDGNLNNWWTDEDRGAFKELTEKLIAQYASYEPLDGKNVNGQLTLGENIADLSGLSIAHKAYRYSLNGEEPPEVAGWTGDQLFFVGWSRVWQRKYRDAEMVRRLLIDPHSPSECRANGPVGNISAFYQAFELKEGDALFKAKEDRIEIW